MYPVMQTETFYPGKSGHHSDQRPIPFLDFRKRLQEATALAGQLEFDSFPGQPFGCISFYRPKTIAEPDHHHHVQREQQNDPEHLSESGFYRAIPYRNPGQFLCCQNRPGRCQYGDWFCSLIYKNGILQKRSPKKDRSCL